jgi:hypothetical protein
MDLPCHAAWQPMLSRGAAVLGTSGWTYDRFAHDRSLCEFSEYGEPTLCRDSTPHTASSAPGARKVRTTCSG